eukprot:scaffold21998_cov147-Skeletonema_menzelii.AAC.3
MEELERGKRLEVEAGKRGQKAKGQTSIDFLSHHVTLLIRVEDPAVSIGSLQQQGFQQAAGAPALNLITHQCVTLQ